MIIKILMENTKNQCQLNCEHGLSIYIETMGHKILFDTGQTDAFIENAECMGVDLSDVDMAILSHGHYDHSGGWAHFLEINHQANIYVNEHAFGSFYSRAEKEIGIPKFLENHKQVVVTQNKMELAEGLELFTCNTKERKYPSDSDNLYMEVFGERKLDEFLHEQYLLITEGEQRVLISGCSHKGILNIIEWFQPDVLIGGFHFKGISMDEAGKEKLDLYAKQLKGSETKYFTCHCTGVEQYEYLKEKLNSQVEYLATGAVLEL